jgi:chromosome segregation ATPase
VSILENVVGKSESLNFAAKLSRLRDALADSHMVRRGLAEKISVKRENVARLEQRRSEMLDNSGYRFKPDVREVVAIEQQIKSAKDEIAALQARQPSIDAKAQALGSLVANIDDYLRRVGAAVKPASAVKGQNRSARRDDNPPRKFALKFWR